ncbi:MAG: SIS domain-containing protein [Vulcanimicrobiaceae bacterium]
MVREYVGRVALRLARIARELALRFERGGRLYALGRGAYATDAAHVSVEFVHPVLVGKRALPAMDASAAPEAWIATLVGERDIVIGFGPPEGDPEVRRALALARERGALVVAFPGSGAEADFPEPCDDDHLHQEIFEILGHTLYESVHVYLEHRGGTSELGEWSFLYPYLTSDAPAREELVDDVARSIVAKAEEGSHLREAVAETQCRTIAAAIAAIRASLARGGKLVLFGNGGSATDATDWAIDCIAPGRRFRPIPAVTLANEPAILTAISNDVGVELVFMRQVIAQSNPQDVAIALSTSGGSKNVIAALGEARKRGMPTVALLGYDGGEIARQGLADFPIVVASREIPRIQETQAAIYHVIREALAEAADAA